MYGNLPHFKHCLEYKCTFFDEIILLLSTNLGNTVSVHLFEPIYLCINYFLHYCIKLKFNNNYKSMYIPGAWCFLSPLVNGHKSDCDRYWCSRDRSECSSRWKLRRTSDQSGTYVARSTLSRWIHFGVRCSIWTVGAVHRAPTVQPRRTDDSCWPYISEGDRHYFRDQWQVWWVHPTHTARPAGPSGASCCGLLCGRSFCRNTLGANIVEIIKIIDYKCKKTYLLPEQFVFFNSSIKNSRFAVIDYSLTQCRGQIKSVKSVNYSYTVILEL